MATIRFYNNCFEDQYNEEEYDFSKPLIDQIESHCNTSYASEYVECYDPETDETFFAPIVESEEDISAVIAVNGNTVDKDYIPQPDDLISVLYLPMSAGTDWARVGMITAGAVLGTMFLGPLLGILIAPVVGAAWVGFLYDSYKNLSTTVISNEKGQQKPDVRGSSNTSLLNNPYPFVIGKHLVTPFIIGDPYTTYSGQNGKDATVRMVYCVGYAPLKLTDFKLEEFFLAYNGSRGGKNYLNGLLKGCSKTDADDGDILNRWSNNDVKLEIMQHNPNDTSVNYGHIYPNKVTQKEIKANLLYIQDDRLKQQAEVVYKGTTFANSFRTNGVWFTESCPMKFTITLNAPSGLYKSYTDEIEKDGKKYNEELYKDIPLWYAIQWRPYDVNNKVSDSEGSDYKSWRDISVFNEYGDQFYTKFGGLLPGKDIEAHLGNTITDSAVKSKSCPEYYKDSQSLYMVKTCNCSSSETKFKITDNGVVCNGKYFYKGNPSTASDNWFVGKILSSTEGYSAVYDSTSKTLYFDENPNSSNPGENNELYSYICDYITVTLSSPLSVTLLNATKLKNYNVSSSDSKTIAVNNYVLCRKYYTNVSKTYTDVYGCWYDRNLINFQSITGKDDDHDGTGQIRLSATVTLTNDQMKEMLASSNKIKSAEIRVIRVSPNYMNQSSVEVSDNSKKSAEAYSDVITLDSITTESFDEAYYYENDEFVPVKIQSEDNMKKFCYVALEAKADTMGNIQSQMKELSCVAESFSPIWHDYKWLPEGVKRVTKYYGYYDPDNPTQKCNRTSSATEVEVTKSAYETARHEGFSWLAVETGSNYKDKINAIVFPSNNSCRETKNTYNADFLSDEASLYNDATASSGFMLAAVGEHNGSFALGYENIDLLSVADCYDAQQCVTDGSTYTISDGSHIAGSVVEIKFEANGFVYQQTKLEDILAKIAAAGRCVYTYDDLGRIRLVMDKPVDYAKGVINGQNIISQNNTYTYETLPAGLRIEFPDENDGYTKNSLYCWADGNKIDNYKGNVRAYNFDFVTNNLQAWSLGRYFLANEVLNREVINAKIGLEGNTYSLGDVILVNNDELLIGDGSGRIQEVIKDDDYVYGFIMDSVYDYKGELDQGESTKGVQILHPKKYGDARITTFRLAAPDTEVTVNGTTYTFTKGKTNLIIFQEPVSIEINEDDIVQFGDYEKISAKYRITKIKPEKDTFTYTLIQYTEDLYNYGTALPSFQNYMTIPEPVSEGITLSETATTIKEQNNVFDNKNKYLNDKINDNKAKFVEIDTSEGTAFVDGAPSSITLKAITVGFEIEDSDTVSWEKDGEDYGNTESISVTEGGVYTLIVSHNREIYKDTQSIISVVNGKDGTSPLYIDLTNEMDSVSLTKDGKVTVDTEFITYVKMYIGVTEQNLTSLSSTSQYITVHDVESGLIKVNIPKGTLFTSDKLNIPVTASCEAGTLTTEFKVQGLKGGVSYKLVPSINNVTKDNNGNISVSSVSCALMKNDTDGYATIDTVPSGYSFVYEKDGAQNIYTIGSSVDISDLNDGISFLLYNDNEVLVDKETIPVLEDGSSFNDQILRCTNEALNLGSSSSWSLGTWRRAAQTKDGEGYTRSVVDIEDCPNANIKKGFLFEDTASAWFHVSQNGLSLKVGQKYTMSCWVKGAGTLLLQHGGQANTEGKWDYKMISVTGDIWQRKAYTFTVKADELKNGVTNIYFGVSTGTLTIAGMKLELGSIDSDWSEYPNDNGIYICDISNSNFSIATNSKLVPVNETPISCKIKGYSGITPLTPIAYSTSNTPKGLQYMIVTPENINGVNITQTTPGTLVFTPRSSAALSSASQSVNVEILFGDNSSQYYTISINSSAKGDDGENGTSVKILGTVSSISELNAKTGMAVGDGYLLSGDLYVWTGSSWINAGRIQGPEGLSSWTPILDGVTKSDNSTFTKTGSTSAWDSQFYSKEGFKRCYISFSAADVTSYVMAGLNSDPTTNNNYTSLDYAIYLRAGSARIYENGSNKGEFATYVAGDVFNIEYDGTLVIYYKNGTALRTIERTEGVLLYADSSFSTKGSKIANVSFGPMGAKGNTGDAGADAVQYYIHYVYVDDLSAGTNYSTTNSRNYVGIYTDTDEADAVTFAVASTKTGIVWSRLRVDVKENLCDGNTLQTSGDCSNWSNNSWKIPTFEDGVWHVQIPSSTATTTGRYRGVYFPFITVTPGKSYKLTCKIKTNKALPGGDNGNYRFYFRDEAQTSTSGYQIYWATGALLEDWTQLTFNTLTIPQDASTQYRFFFRIYGVLSNISESELWVKDIKVEENDVASAFCLSVNDQKGNSVGSITEYYLASTLDSGVTTETSGWTTAGTNPTLALPYLWNYEKFTYSDGTFVTTTPTIIGKYSKDGKAIVGITEKYLGSDKNSGITVSTSGWSTFDKCGFSETNKYLWNYEEIKYNDNGTLSTEKTTPAIVGVWGEAGSGVNPQMLRGTNTSYKMNSSSGGWVKGLWGRSSAGEATMSVISVSDCPNPVIHYGWKFVCTTDSPSNHTSALQSSVPILNGHTYTFSCYARKSSDTATAKLFNIQWTDSSHSASKSISITTEWKYYTFTFTSNISTSIIGFGVAKSGKTGDYIEICGAKLEEGDSATQWCEYEEDKKAKPLANQLLRGTLLTNGLSSSSAWSSKTWRTAGTKDGSSTTTRTVVTISDCPDSNITKALKVVNTSTSSVDAVIRQDNVPIIPGQLYTLSCWAYGTGTVKFQYGKDPKWYADYVSITGNYWRKLSWTFTVASDESTTDNKTHIYFGSIAPGTTVYIAGLKMELDGESTDWCEYEADKKGDKGEPGDSGYTYEIDCPVVFKKGETITANAYVVKDGTRTASSVYWEWETYSGNTWTMSSSHPTATFCTTTAISGPSKVRFSIYASSSKDSLLDREELSLITDDTTVIEIGNDNITLGCDKDGKLKSAYSETVKVASYYGTSRVASTITKSSNTSNMTVGTITGGTTSADGTIKLSLAAGTEVTEGVIKFSIRANGITVEKTINISTSNTGATGDRGYSSRTIAYKVNYSGFSTAGLGEIYVCGYNSSGNQADVPGYVIVNGVTYYIKGKFYPNCTMDGYMIVEKSTDSSVSKVPVYAYYDWANGYWAYVTNGQSQSTITNTKIETLSDWICLGKVFAEVNNAKTGEGNVTFDEITPCLFDSIFYPFEYSYLGIITDTDRNWTTCWVKCYKIEQSGTKFSIDAGKWIAAHRGDIVFKMGATTPTMDVLRVYDGTCWADITSESSIYRTVISKMAGDIPAIAGFYKSKGKDTPTICGTYIETLTANTAFIESLFANEISVGNLIKSKNYTPSSENSVGSGFQFNKDGIAELNELKINGMKVNYDELHNLSLGINCLSATDKDPETSIWNIGIGVNVLKANNAGANNVGIGTEALKSNTEGLSNIGIGTRAMAENVTGVGNVGVGYLALDSNISGNYNVGVGAVALDKNTIGDNNVGIGNSPLYENTTGDNNVGIGLNSLGYNTTGFNNVGIGSNCFYDNISRYKLKTWNNMISIGNRIIYLEFSSSATQNVVFRTITAFVCNKPNAYSETSPGIAYLGMSCMGIVGTPAANNNKAIDTIYYIDANTINLINSYGTNYMTLNINNNSAIGQAVQLCFIRKVDAPTNSKWAS